ncbi:MAG: PHP domain-containing protein, partial [Planctomycetaceae bacterium]|nr:PHP domain-containing protein [Planctomycetaceae bacterium]
MPDPAPSKRQPLTGGHCAPAGAYAELHCKTNFSFLEGASHPDELVQRAGELGHAALAITDRNSVAGVVRAHVAAKEIGLKLLIGAEVTPGDAPPVVLLATDRDAYGRLCRLLTLGCRRAPKGECRLTFEDVARHAPGLLGLVTSAFRRYRDAFGDRCYAMAELHRGPRDEQVLERIVTAARRARVPLIAANDVHYHVPGRRFLQDVLTATRYRCAVSELGARIFPNGERYLKSAAQMAELFAEAPEAVTRTLEVAARCTFSLDELRYEYPHELCPPGTTPLDYLKRLAWEGAARRYPHGLPDKVRRLIEHELALIEELRYEFYFLTVWDLVRFAREREILCQGRGSAANSAV